MRKRTNNRPASARKALKTPHPAIRQREGLVRQIVPKAISRVRKDMESWRRALRHADSVERPRRRELMDLYADVMLDAPGVLDPAQLDELHLKVDIKES